jgi:hypothetical protein
MPGKSALLRKAGPFTDHFSRKKVEIKENNFLYKGYTDVGRKVRV